MALSPGKWTASVNGEPRLSFEVVSGVVNTPFVIDNYGGGIPDAEHGFFSGPGPMPVEERIRMYRETYGINRMMLTGHHGGPASAKDFDRAAKVGARVSAQHVVAGQHQPGGTSTSWADPDVLMGTRYRASWAAQKWRRLGGGVFDGVHYADEPGLTWGIGNEDGTMRSMFPREQGWYTGPFAVPAQHELFRATTGEQPPDFRNPRADFDRWLAFQRFRSEILGDVFAALTREVHRVDPEMIGFSQVYAWRALAEGIYPRATARGLDVHATHGYGSWTYLRHMYPASIVDAQRVASRDKPLWMLGPWLGNQADEGGVRAVVYGVLARKVEGIIWPLDWMRHWPEAAEVSQRILPISGVLAKADKRVDPVALLQSRDSHLEIIAQDWRSSHPGRPYYGRMLTAWWSLQAAGYPSTWIVEEDLLQDRIDKHRVLIAPSLVRLQPQHRRALEAYIERGGVVLMDQNSRVNIKGARRLPFAFDNGFDETLLPRLSPVISANTQLAFDTLIRGNLPALTSALSELVTPAVTTASPHVLQGVYDAGEAKYVWLVNQKNRKSNEVQYSPEPLTTRVELPDVDAYAAAFDVLNGLELQERRFQTHFRPGDAKFYALFERAPGAFGDVVGDYEQGHVIARTQLLDASGEPLAAIVPLRVTLHGPGGDVLEKVFRATGKDGVYDDRFAIGRANLQGRYRVVIENVLTGTRTMAAATKPSTPEPIENIDTGPVELYDQQHIEQMFQEVNDVLLLASTPVQRAQAQRLAEALKPHGIRAEIADAAEHTQPVKLAITAFKAWSGFAVFPNAIHRHVIVLGDDTSNPVMKQLLEIHNLPPHPVDKDAPGTGRALVWWVRAAFGIDHQAIAVLARDDQGLRRGVDRIVELLQNLQPASGG